MIISDVARMFVSPLRDIGYFHQTCMSVFTRTLSTQHITPVPQELQWLPVKYHIHFKILLLTFQSLYNLAPPYLSDLLHIATPSRTPRSSSITLIIPPAHLTTMGFRAFSRVAPRPCSSLLYCICNIDSLPVFQANIKISFCLLGLIFALLTF